MNSLIAFIPRSSTRFPLCRAHRFAAALACGLLSAICASVGLAQSKGGSLDGRLQPWIEQATAWAASPEIVAAVKERNLALPESLAKMDNAAWSNLTENDPVMVSLRCTPAGKFLRRLRSNLVCEVFLNDAAGRKVAIAQKTTKWVHQGSPKHDLPMSGQVWNGAIEFDQSVGLKQVQISVPVLDQGKPIGSLVVGLSVYELALNDRVVAPSGL